MKTLTLTNDEYNQVLSALNRCGYWDLNEKLKSESSETTQEVVVNTKKGVLKATPATDPNFPGIYIDFSPFQEDWDVLSIPSIVVEMPESTGILQAFIWSNSSSEDYTDKIRFE